MYIQQSINNTTTVTRSTTMNNLPVLTLRTQDEYKHYVQQIMPTNSTSMFIHRHQYPLIHYDRVIVRTNTFVYTTNQQQQQQKNEKEKGKDFEDRMSTNTTTNANKFNKYVYSSSSISLIHYDRVIVRTNTFVYTTKQQQQQQEKEKEKGKECYQLQYCSHRLTIQYIINCRNIQYNIYIHTRQKGNMISINELYFC